MKPVRNRPGRTAVVLLVAAVACTAPAFGSSLHNALPKPGDLEVAGQAAFVGFKGSLGVAVVRRGKQLEAFVCDGRKRWAKLDGRVKHKALELKGDHASSLSLRSAGRGLKGTLRLSGRKYRVNLGHAQPGAGLFREVLTQGTQRIEAEWVVGNDGHITGVGIQGKTAVTTSTIPADDTLGTDGTSQSSDSGVEPLLFDKLRCKALVVAESRFEGKQLNGTVTAEDFDAQKARQQKFGDLKCFERFGFHL